VERALTEVADLASGHGRRGRGRGGAARSDLLLQRPFAWPAFAMSPATIGTNRSIFT
jgi:hypothetical protein